MSIATHQSASRALSWFSLLGGAVAWTLHLVFAYLIAEFGCVSGLAHRNLLGISLVAWPVIVVTALTVLVSATATVAGYRRTSDLPTHYVARAGALTSGLFTMVILFESIPILYYLRDC